MSPGMVDFLLLLFSLKDQQQSPTSYHLLVQSSFTLALESSPITDI